MKAIRKECCLMKFFQEFFIIIFFSVLGEGIRIFAHLPIPGSILGILFLFLAS